MLLGMVLFFGGLGYSFSVYTARSLFGVDLMSDPASASRYSDPAVVSTLRYVQALTAAGMFIIPAWIFCRALERMPADYLKINRAISPAQAVLAVLIVVAIAPFISWLVYINKQVTFPQSWSDLEFQLKAAEDAAGRLTEAFLNVESVWGLAANLLVMALIAAVGEELIFRGVLQNFVREVSGHRHFAVIFVALVFSAIHGQFYGFIARFVLGLVLGYAYLFTGNLWVSILIHFANNAFAVIFSWKPLASRLPGPLTQDHTFEAWYINAASALVTLGLLVVLHRVSRKKSWQHGE